MHLTSITAFGSGWEEKLVLFVCVCSTMVFVCSLQHWTKLSKSGKEPWPEERRLHAACCLNYDQHDPQLLVTGGQNRRLETLGDAWILHVDSGRWRKVRHICSCTVHRVMVTLHKVSEEVSVNGLVLLFYFDCMLVWHDKNVVFNLNGFLYGCKNVSEQGTPSVCDVQEAMGA